MIHFSSENIDLPALNYPQVERWIRAVAAQYNFSVGELNYIFCDDEKILAVNREFLQHDYYTDIITFDYTEENVINGELYISIDTVRANAQEYGQSFPDELHRVIIHGILHLCGLDDHCEEDIKEMREAENLSLEKLSVILNK